jgi:16S rRNA (guanine1207-N2)-methyltransferase
MTNSFHDLTVVQNKIRPPVAVILGAPGEVVRLVTGLETPEVVCYQMDLYQADRLREELGRQNLTAQVVTAPDLWDLAADLQTVLYPVPPGGERHLKIDMIEQGFHVLRPRGTLIVLSSYAKDEFFPTALKKVFGRFHAPMTDVGQVFWAQREGERPRRRHEVCFQARMADGPSLRFLSRPGVISYGRFDNGARALVETMSIAPGDRIVDVGCGCGTNGIWAGRLSGPTGRVSFIDSNLRALALAELNARANGLTHFQTVASRSVAGVPAASFDVALANPPYYAQASIAQLFVERCRILLRPRGRFYLVTKQADQVGPLVANAFGTPKWSPDAVIRYSVPRPPDLDKRAGSGHNRHAITARHAFPGGKIG